MLQDSSPKEHKKKILSSKKILPVYPIKTEVSLPIKSIVSPIVPITTTVPTTTLKSTVQPIIPLTSQSSVKSSVKSSVQPIIPLSTETIPPTIPPITSRTIPPITSQTISPITSQTISPITSKTIPQPVIPITSKTIPQPVIPLTVQSPIHPDIPSAIPSTISADAFYDKKGQIINVKSIASEKVWSSYFEGQIPMEEDYTCYRDNYLYIRVVLNDPNKDRIILRPFDEKEFRYPFPKNIVFNFISKNNNGVAIAKTSIDDNGIRFKFSTFKDSNDNIISVKSLNGPITFHYQQKD